MQQKVVEKNPMLGSIHVNTDGYGYGARYPTNRNRMTLPANVPSYRHVPDSERYLRKTSSTRVIKTDEESVKRNAQQVMYQTSGEIGFHYLGFDPEPIRLNKKPLRSTSVVKSVPKEKFASSANDHSSDGERYLTERYTERSALSTGRSMGNDFTPSFTNQRERFAHTLLNLDPSFDRQRRRDLFVASMPPKPMQELVGVATSNNHSAMQSLPWVLKLRIDTGS
jgi:hypothetical protein